MNSASTLSTAPLEHPAMDYAVLRAEGIGHLEKMTKGAWSDFNAHDPGITTLEQLCYAITDLGYRIAYDLPDLLATDSGADPYGSLYSPARILTSHPVTLTDLRKCVLDVKGVKNAWIEVVDQGAGSGGNATPQLHYHPGDGTLSLQGEEGVTEPVSLKGLYRVFIEKSELVDRDGAAVTQAVARRLHANRGLCEDFEEIRVLDTQKIQVSAQVTIGPVDDPAAVLLGIFQRLAAHISPSVRFHTLGEMLAAGKFVDEIFDGPLLEHGFIDTVALDDLQRKTALRTSDLIHEIMDVPGVRAVRNITVAAGGEPEPWSLDLDPARTPGLDLENSKIRLEKDGLAVSLDVAGVIAAYHSKLANTQAASAEQQDIRPPRGRDRHLGDYYAMQRQFPAVYGVGELGLPASAPPERKARAKQLKAYLMFFEQLLANQFAQLAHARELFSFQGEGARTYFSQVINDPELGLDDIRVRDPAAHATALQQITETGRADPMTPAASDPERRNRFLNHLLARFGEQLTDYALILHDLMPVGASAQEKLIRDKQAFLQDYPRISSARGAGFDYTAASANASGLARRIRLALGIEGEEAPDFSLAQGDGEGFYLVEHILLRPMPGDEYQESPLLVAGSKDPYSLQISFVFPDWPPRFQKETFRQFIKQTIRGETPVHLTPYVHWLDKAAMATFETAYQDWLEKRRGL